MRRQFTETRAQGVAQKAEFHLDRRTTDSNINFRRRGQSQQSSMFTTYTRL